MTKLQIRNKLRKASAIVFSSRVQHSAMKAGVTTVIGLAAFSGAANAATVANGGFETGDFTGWEVVEQSGGFGFWFNTTGNATPVTGTSIPAPSEGTQYAVTDQILFSIGSRVLYQDISLEAGSQHTLSFDWFAQSLSGVAGGPTSVDAGTMDYNAFPNQQFRVDIVPVGFTDWFGADSNAGILANIVAPTAQDFQVTGWGSTTFDLTPWAGSNVRLAFRQADNLNFFNAGVDNVRIASTEPVPEPLTIMGSLTAGAFGVALRRRQKQQQKAAVKA